MEKIRGWMKKYMANCPKRMKIFHGKTSFLFIFREKREKNAQNP